MKLRVYVAFLGLLVVSAASGLAPSATAAVAAKPHVALQQLFDGYGDSGKGSTWTGGAPVQSVSLPDGRTAWSFATTYLGTVAKNKSRDAATPTVHSSWVIQAKGNGKLTTTVLGAGNTDFYPSPVPGAFYEPAGAVVENGKLYQLLWLTADVNNPVRIDVATISLPSFTLEGITTTKFLDTHSVQTSAQLYPTVWGGAVVQDSTYTYVYGTENTYADFANFAHVARIPRGQFATGTPEYWSGSGWDATTPLTSARIFGGTTLGGVHLTGSNGAGGLRLVAQGYGVGTSAYDVMMWTAKQPQGPYKSTFVYTIKKEPGDNGCCALAYYPMEVPQYETGPSSLVVGYLDDGGTDHTSNVRLYRPRFVNGTIG
ncbi:MAG: hypothetical protein JJD92_02150 [Frankiaceae bacterium]|nr:hypothetical protein [Frankiaceae bacterium]